MSHDDEPGPSQALPNVMIVSATPIAGEWATSDLMRSLFANWPPGKLSQIVLARDGVEAASQPIPTLTLALDGTRHPRALAAAMQQARRFCADSGATVLYFRSAGWPLAFEALPLWLKRCIDLRLVTHLMDDWPARLARTRPAIGAPASRVVHAVLRASDGCLAISQPMADHYESIVGRPFSVVHNGVEDASDATARDSFLQNGPVRILYSGGAAADQSADALADAIRAVELLADRGVDVQLDLALTPRHVDDMRRRVGESTAVRLLDFVEPDEHRQRLRSADMLLMAFNFDPTTAALLRLSMANKVGDYLAARRPIVVYGPADLATVASARSLGWGHVVYRHGPHHLADGLAEIIGDPNLRAGVVSAAGAAARTEFDATRHRHRFESVVRGA